MHRTYLAGIERALRNPALENLVKLANALDTSLAELFVAGDGETLPARKASASKEMKARRQRRGPTSA